MPASFKTYEAQARLLAAVVAAHPELRLNYKAIAKHYGKSQTVSAMEHRFRPVRQQAEIIRKIVTSNGDPESFNLAETSKDELAKYFGESTPEGLQWQFRGIKQNADAMKVAVKNGGDPIAAFNSGGGNGGGPSTPSGKGTKAKVGGSTGKSTGGAKRGRAPKLVLNTHSSSPSIDMTGTAPEVVGIAATPTPKRRATKGKTYVEPASTDNDDSPEVDYSELDESPIKKKVRTTPLKNVDVPHRDKFLAEARKKAAAQAAAVNAVNNKNNTGAGGTIQSAPASFAASNNGYNNNNNGGANSGNGNGFTGYSPSVAPPSIFGGSPTDTTIDTPASSVAEAVATLKHEAQNLPMSAFSSFPGPSNNAHNNNGGGGNPRGNFNDAFAPAGGNNNTNNPFATGQLDFTRSQFDLFGPDGYDEGI
ncbi:hypothetical protein B0H63DRAFT_249095 [Podospora didyma]|uniref:Uncharacterized protein n=1 Tax=Podospora didyma TaxID=330526 RepID=A0AAE0KM96_9PEZI|nr:hypothetical protein B0H63DRAFT_249095 [Podospora didyma]